VRARTVIEIRVEAVDELDSELHITADDGTALSFRSLQSRHATIEHAAERLADHYGLDSMGPHRWIARDAEDRRERGDGPIGSRLLAAGG
jgi:hypothetical protein